MNLKLNYKDTDIAEARPSKIHGTGLYLKKSIPWGTRFIEYKGKHVRGKEIQKAIQEGEKDYLFEISDTEFIDGYPNDNLARFVNQSCDPTCFVLRENERIFYVTREDMKPGDEITVDYGSWDNNLKCNCGSKNCEGVM